MAKKKAVARNPKGTKCRGCGKTFANQHGLRIHHGKSSCKG